MTEIKDKPRGKPFQRRKEERKPKTTHVVFWNGVHFSPCVKTTNERIEERLRSCINDYAKGHRPGSMSAQFVAITLAEGLPAEIFSLPEKNVGGTVAFMERPEFWPRDGRELGGGVFLIDVETGSCSYWGGQGLHEDDRFNPGIPAHAELRNVEIVDDGGNDQGRVPGA